MNESAIFREEIVTPLYVLTGNKRGEADASPRLSAVFGFPARGAAHLPALSAASLRSRRWRTSSLLGWMSPALVSAHLVNSGPTSS